LAGRGAEENGEEHHREQIEIHQRLERIAGNDLEQRLYERDLTAGRVLGLRRELRGEAVANRRVESRARTLDGAEREV